MHKTAAVSKSIVFPGRKSRFAKYPWQTVDVGDSFLSFDNDTELEFRGLAYRAGKRLGRKFSVRKTLEGLRVWRIA